MRAPRVLDEQKEPTVDERRPNDPWKDGSRVHIVSGVSVLEAKRIVRTLDDAAFDSERAQLVQPLSKAMIERQRGQRVRTMELVRPPPVRAKLTRAPPPPPPHAGSSAFERTLMLLFLLALLGLQLAQFVRV